MEPTEGGIDGEAPGVPGSAGKCRVGTPGEGVSVQYKVVTVEQESVTGTKDLVSGRGKEMYQLRLSMNFPE